jgi:hypothetical protein
MVNVDPAGEVCKRAKSVFLLAEAAFDNCESAKSKGVKCDCSKELDFYERGKLGRTSATLVLPSAGARRVRNGRNGQFAHSGDFRNSRLNDLMGRGHL